MKNITLFIILLSFNTYAQFPAPYCNIDPEGTTVEEITTVNFAEVDIVNTNVSSILVDATDQIGFLNDGDSSILSVGGNTLGEFDNDIVAFIDWNNNGVLDDEGEVFQVGTITNSTGDDGNTVSLEIGPPGDVEYNTNLRIRITKIYKDKDSPAEIDPCAISFNPFGQGVFPGFGQAIDFNLFVGLVAVDEFNITALKLYPLPAEDILNIEYNNTINKIEMYTVLGQKILVQNNLTSSLQLDTSKLNSGTYFLKIITKNSFYTTQIIKQ